MSHGKRDGRRPIERNSSTPQTDPAVVRSAVVGTAGHIDHGKTALVLALTGTDTDRLPEEKARGITIDLGFAALSLKGRDGQSLDLSLIDVPGHHAFVRNMLAGAGGIDAVMLVVAADEGVRAQTEEHLQICRLLGIRHGLIVLTKSDAVQKERLEAARGEVRRLVKDTFLEGAPVLAVSALRREGLTELKATLADLFGQISLRDAERVPRLPVDRVFSVKGFGTVVTGTLQAGFLRAGQSLVLEPGRRGVRVRGLQVHGRARAEAVAPNRVALNLTGVEVAEIQRGAIVVPEETLEPTSVLDVEVEMLPDAAPLRQRQRVRIHAFASESLATVLLYPSLDAADPGKQVIRLRLFKPMMLLPGDRFVLRQPSPATTLGGGRVLDAHPVPKLRKSAAAGWLQQICSVVDTSQRLLLLVQRQGERGITLRRLVTETGWSAQAVARLIGRQVAAGRAFAGVGGEAWIASEALAKMEDAIFREVARSGAAAGVPRAVLRSRMGLQEWVFTLAANRLQAAGKVARSGDTLRLPERQPSTLKFPAVTGRAAEIERLYLEGGLASPIVSEVAERSKMSAAELRQVITALLRTGKLVRLGSDALLVHAEALKRLIVMLQQRRGQILDVGTFKSLTGLTRKHAIPLLEYLDGVRITRSAGGVRVVL